MKNARLEVIEKALGIEAVITAILGSKLGIDIDSSNLFGNGFGAMSFDNKCTLMLETKLLNATTREYLGKIGQLRNKFAHVMECHSYETAFKMTNLTNWALKRFKPEEGETSEEYYSLVFLEIGVYVQRELLLAYGLVIDEECLKKYTALSKLFLQDVFKVLEAEVKKKAITPEKIKKIKAQEREKLNTFLALNNAPTIQYNKDFALIVNPKNVFKENQ